MFSKSGVIDKNTGERGIILQVGAIKWISNDAVVVEGGYKGGNIGASCNIFLLNHLDGLWIVNRDTMNWIS
jgi:hypothetical protein